MKQTDQELRNRIADAYGDEILFANDHDNAILGIVSRCGQCPFIVYDGEVVAKNLMRQGMTEEEAEDWIGYNWYAWVGPSTPAILDKVR